MEKAEYNFKKIFALIKLDQEEIKVIYIYAILSGLIQLSLPLGIQSILGFVLGATLVTSVYILIAVLIIAVFIVGMLQINQMKLIEKIQQKIFVRFTFAFSEKIPNLEIKELENQYLPEKINRFFDTLNIQKGISRLLLDIPTAFIQILFGLVLLSFYHSLFILFSVILTLIVLGLLKYTSKKGLKTSMEESNHKYSLVSWLEEMGRVIKSFKFSQGTHLNLINADKILLKYINARTSHFHVLIFQYRLLVYFKVGITATMLILGTYLLFEQKINIGQFVAAEIVIIGVINALEKLIVSLEKVYDVTTGLYKLDSLLDLPEEKNGSHQLYSDEVGIEVQNISFSYNDSQKVLKDISFWVAPKSITCISGEENSGKSTLLKLITGIYKDYEGSIKFNQVPLQNYSNESIRSQMGILLNEQELFEGTVYENITLGKQHISIDEIISLIKEIGFDNFISSFPDSMNTQIQPLGKTLSTSLIKKILILRAFIHKPSLYILEEPWQGLDAEATRQVQQYLLKIAQSKTVIISCNDPLFIQKCTQSIQLSKGSILNKI